MPEVDVPFFGESHGLDHVENVSGGSVNDAGLFFDDGITCPVSTGDSFMAYIFPDPYALTATDTAVMSWVIVHTGSGSIRLSDGMDPAWGGGPSVATNSLGTHAVTGGELVVATATPTVAALVAQDDSPALFVEVLSGAVDVDQVKLRVWPPGGVKGGLSALHEGFDTAGGGRHEAYLSQGPEATGNPDGTIDYSTSSATGGEQESWEAAFTGAAAPASHVGPLEESLSSPAASSPADRTAISVVEAFSNGPSLGEYFAQWLIHFGFLHIDRGTPMENRAGNPPGDEGVDYLRHPDMVPQDGWAYMDTGRALPTLEWVNLAWTVAAEAGESFIAAVDPQPFVESGLADIYGNGTLLWAADVPEYNITPEYRAAEYLDSVVLIDGGGSASKSLSDPDDPITQAMQAADSLRLTLFPMSTTDVGPGGPRSISATARARFGTGDIVNGPFTPTTFVAHQPPYRVWTLAPGELPRQQVQRDDGLTVFSTARWSKASSRQSSNRWRGYV